MKIRMILAVLLCSAALVSAQSYVATINSAQETTGSTSTGTGSGTFSLSGSSFTYDVVYSGLLGNYTASHIHVGAPGVQGGVVFPLTHTPNGTHAGSMAGTVNLTSSQISDLQNNLWYVNIHSSTWSQGEIRGQIVPVPEPSTWALMGFGALGLLWSLRRRRA